MEVGEDRLSDIEDVVDKVTDKLGLCFDKYGEIQSIYERLNYWYCFYVLLAEEIYVIPLIKFFYDHFKSFLFAQTTFT